jgi:predicted ATPase
MDPWREDVVREMIVLRAEAGDRAGALHAYRDFARRLHDELGVDPLPETVAVYEGVCAGESGQVAQARRPTEPPRANLPAYLTSFIDRHRELAVLQSALGDRRLVTLTGTGGVGKTRLAIETARTVLDRFPDGIWLVELGNLGDDRLIVPEICSAIGLGDHSESALIAGLRERHLLLVLDNCEHLSALPKIAERLVLACPGVRILATSREPLRIAGERIERLPSLPTTAGAEGQSLPPIEDLQKSPAVQLFLDRARDVAAFEVLDATEDDRRALAAIASRLDGIPLAIELAAARMSSLNLTALARRLDNRFSLLTGGSRAALPRQQTLRATLDWSYGLLSPLDQRVFARMGVFLGGWTLGAAAAVCSGLDLEYWEIQDRLASLVDKSLVLADRSGGVRFRLLETMRAYALEQLDEDERELTEALHARYFASIAREGDSFPIRDGAWFKTYKHDIQNIRSAMNWAIRQGSDPALGVPLAQSFAWFAYNTALAAEAADWCEAALVALGPNPGLREEADLQLGLAIARDFLRYGSALIAPATQAAALYRELDDKPQLAYALYYICEAHLRMRRPLEGEAFADEGYAVALQAGDVRAQGRLQIAKARTLEQRDPGERVRLLTHAAALFESIGDRHGVFSALIQLGECLFEHGESAQALEKARECIAMLDENVETEQHPLGVVLNNAAAYSIRLGRIDEAIQFAQRALSVARRMSDRPLTAYALQYIAAVALAHGQADRAARLFGASNAFFDPSVAGRSWYTDRSSYERSMTQLESLLPQSRIAQLMEDGARLRSDEAVSEARRVGSEARQ